MSRLATEWQRLYAADGVDPAVLITAQGQVRCLVLSLGRPADWRQFQAVWQAVQTEGSLPAPGIAVSGTDSYQLWFSLAEAVPAPQAHAFLVAVCARYLVGVAPSRLQLLPEPDATQAAGARHAACVPAPAGGIDQWSAFVAPDLAPVFEDSPWLNIPPSPEGQAELLGRLRSIGPAAWRDACARWLPTDTAGALDGQATSQTTAPGTHPSLAVPHAAQVGPRLFLLNVMNDAAVPLALRIEAAKALLHHEVAPAPTDPTRALQASDISLNP